MLDEKKARRVAERIGLRYTGTVGLLLAAKNEGKIKKLRPLLDELLVNDFYLDEKFYGRVLRLAGE